MVVSQINVTVYHFDLLWNAGEEVEAGALWVRELEKHQSLAPGTYVEGDIMFDIPQNKKPLKLFFKLV